MAKSKLFTAVRHLALDKEMSQRDVADAIGRDNASFWENLNTKTVNFDYLEDACKELDADIIIRSRSSGLEYVINPKKENQNGN